MSNYQGGPPYEHHPQQGSPPHGEGSPAATQPQQGGGSYQSSAPYQGGPPAYQGGTPPHMGAPHQGGGTEQRSRGQSDLQRRLSTETKSALLTTELVAYVLTVLGIFITAAVVDETADGGFDAERAWLYVTLLTIGYLLSRGLAKSGSREPYDEDR